MSRWSLRCRKGHDWRRVVYAVPITARKRCADCRTLDTCTVQEWNALIPEQCQVHTDRLMPCSWCLHTPPGTPGSMTAYYEAETRYKEAISHGES